MRPYPTMLVYIFRHRLLGTLCLLLFALAILFSSYRIYMTSEWLQSLRDYIVDHDARQQAAMVELRQAIGRVEAKLRHE